MYYTKALKDNEIIILAIILPIILVASQLMVESIIVLNSQSAYSVDVTHVGHDEKSVILCGESL